MVDWNPKWPCCSAIERWGFHTEACPTHHESLDQQRARVEHGRIEKARADKAAAVELARWKREELPGLVERVMRAGYAGRLPLFSTPAATISVTGGAR